MRITKLNLFALNKIFGGAKEITNALSPNDYRVMRRCLKAGLVQVSEDKATLKLTEAGIEALNDYIVTLMLGRG